MDVMPHVWLASGAPLQWARQDAPKEGKPVMFESVLLVAGSFCSLCAVFAALRPMPNNDPFFV
jgi:hypothetical protein